MQLSVAAYDLNLIAHQSFQNVLQEIWFYKIMPDNNKFKVISSIIRIKIFKRDFF